MSNTWLNRFWTAARKCWNTRIAPFDQRSAGQLATPSQVKLCRLAFVVVTGLILMHSWLPHSATAQSQSDVRTSASNSTSFRNSKADRPQAKPRPKASRPSNVNQPSQFVDDNLERNSDTDGSRAVQSNRVAQAELRQPATEESPDETIINRNPPVSGFDLKQIVNVDQLVSPQGLKSSVGMGLAVTVLSLAPAILMMSTCFVRFIVVLSLLRQALGTPNLPPNQVLMGLSLCLTFLVMAPVWNESYQEGIRPYTEAKSEALRPSLPEVFDNTVAPLRRFMSQQIEKSNNADAVWMFIEYQRPLHGTIEAETWEEPETYDDVSLTVLLPAYLLSELKTAFLIGFQIYLPFLIIDLVTSSVLMSMGLLMLSPTQVSLPFKLLLFVLIDGWTLTVGMLIESVRLAT